MRGGFEISEFLKFFKIPLHPNTHSTLDFQLLTELERDRVNRQLKIEKRPHIWEDKTLNSEAFESNPAKTIKKKRNHRYTREQRNAMRKGMEQLTNYLTAP